jgi:hypothetical protein
MICAFQEGDAQFACDPGCCVLTSGGEKETDTAGTDTAGTDTAGTESFPLWAIILLIVLGSLMFSIFMAWIAKKMSRTSSNGG